MFFAASPLLPLVERRVGELRVLLGTGDRTLARSVFTSGDWDPLLVGTVFDALEQLGYDHRGSTFVEIGANFGIYSLPAVAEHGFARAIAFEPEPDAFALLARNVERNSLGDRVVAVQRALSDRPGELTLVRAGRNAGDNRIVGELDVRGRRDIVRVRASTFDQEVAEGTISLDDVGLVWLDVQGHEAEVLRGAASLLQSDIPVVLEYSTSMMSPASRARLDQLVAGHYDVMVDLGWSALTDRIRFQPATAIRRLAPGGRAVETDLLLL